MFMKTYFKRLFIAMLAALSSADGSEARQNSIDFSTSESMNKPAAETTIKDLIPLELHFLITPNSAQLEITSEMLSKISYNPEDLFQAAELAHSSLPFQVTRKLYVLSISPRLLYKETYEPFNRWITAVEHLINLKTSKKSITALLKTIENWLYNNETYLTCGNHSEQAFWDDREALDTA